MANSPAHNEQIQHHSRGYLPHYDSTELTQFVTFRLANSLPATILRTLEIKRAAGKMNDLQYQWEVEKTLDLGRGPVFLKRPEIARLVSETIIRFDGEKYVLKNWTVMPNHVHLLVRTLEGFTLSEAIHSIKSFTALRANRLLGRKGRFWSPDYFDRFIRNYIHFNRVYTYVDENPVKAGLCSTPSDWQWSRAGWRPE